jgi:hypothetical protein
LIASYERNGSADDLESPAWKVYEHRLDRMSAAAAPVSDISGKTIPPKTGGTAKITYANGKPADEFKLTADEVAQLLLG